MLKFRYLTWVVYGYHRAYIAYDTLDLAFVYKLKDSFFSAPIGARGKYKIGAKPNKLPHVDRRALGSA